MIRETPANQGAEASADVLVVSCFHSSGTRLTLALDTSLDGGPMDPPSGEGAVRTRSHPPPNYSASEGIGGARGLGNLVRPVSHPELRVRSWYSSSA